MFGNRGHETTQSQGDTGRQVIDPASAPTGRQALVAAAKEVTGQGIGPWEIVVVVSEGSNWEILRGDLYEGTGGAGEDEFDPITVYESTNGGARVVWGSGTRDIIAGIAGHQLFELLSGSTLGIPERTAGDTFLYRAILQAGRDILNKATPADQRTHLDVYSTSEVYQKSETYSQAEADSAFVEDGGGVDQLRRGTRAARPAATAVPTGTFYFVSDDPEPAWYYSDATDWFRIGYRRFADGDLNGFTLSKFAARQIAIAAGEALSDLGSGEVMDLVYSGGFEKDLGATWAEGDGLGGMAAGQSIAADDWFHVFALGKPLADNPLRAETVDFGFDTIPTGANLLADADVVAAGYTKARRLGTWPTDGSSNLIDVRQDANEFRWDGIRTLTTPLADHTNPGVLEPVDVPSGVRCELLTYLEATAGGKWLIVDPSETARAPTSDDFTFDQAGSIGLERAVVRSKTNTSQQVRAISTLVGSMSMTFHQLGWLDPRGQR